MNWPSIAHGIFKAGSNFRVGWWAGGGSFLFFKGFLQVLAGFSGWGGGRGLGAGLSFYGVYTLS